MTRGGNSNRSSPLEGFPWVRRQLILDLALDTQTHEKLAEKYGVSRYSITSFKKRHAVDIDTARVEAEEEFAGILITKKENRLAVYQDQIEQAIHRGDHKLIARLLRQVAEEMGHLPSRVQLTGSVGFQTSYIITDEAGQPIDMKLLT